MDHARLAQVARAAGLVFVATTTAASCRLGESLDSFTNGEGGAATGGVGGSGAAGTGGFAGDAGGIGGSAGDAATPDGSGGDSQVGGGGTGGTGGTGTGGTQDAGDAASDAPTSPCASGDCSGSCRDCNSDQLCETDTNTDKNNCGACGHSCQGGDCQGGICQTLELASNLDMPWGIVADEAKVYWVAEGSPNGGTVASVSVTGGSSSPLATGQSAPVYLVADAQYLYWTTFANGGAIWRINKDGTGENKLTLATGPQGLAADDTDIWWTNNGDGSIKHILKMGNSPQTALSGLTDPRGIAVDPDAAGKVYWTSLSGGEIHSANKDGTGATTLAANEDHPIAIAVDTNFVYWLDAGTYSLGDCSAANGKLVRATKADGSGRTEFATGQACPLALWLDLGGVYWTNTGTVAGTTYNYDGSVMYLMTGGSPQVFEAGQVRPYGITTNSNSVFWSEQGFGSSGAIKKRAK